MKQFSPAFERNREPIAAALTEALAGCARVLEVGSGSGQHAAWFAARFPGITWFPTELPEFLPSIEAWRAESGLVNVEPARVLDVFAADWPDVGADAVVTLNTLHIVSWPGVEAIVSKAAALLPADGVLYVYGPFRYASRALEPSNENFDQWLRARDAQSGIRLFEDVDALAREGGLSFEKDLAMPANNRSIWWRKSGH